MINLKNLIREQVKKLSFQQAKDNKLFGPVYHGTSKDKRDVIDREGFKIFKGSERSGNVSHGYQLGDYYGGYPPPIHHLGFGIYFTTVLSIAKQFNFGTASGLRIYYLNVPNIEKINWGSPRTMMKWWIENGYDYKITPETKFGSNTLNRQKVQEERIRATNNLTKVLSSKYDAVWYKGRGVHTLLDGDQVCVYDVNNIYEVDKSLTKPGEIGSRVQAVVNIDRFNKGIIDIPIGTKGTVLKKEPTDDILKNYPLSKHWIQDAKFIYNIKWDKGGTIPNVLDKWIAPYEKKKK